MIDEIWFTACRERKLTIGSAVTFRVAGGRAAGRITSIWLGVEEMCEVVTMDQGLHIDGEATAERCWSRTLGVELDDVRLFGSAGA